MNSDKRFDKAQAWSDKNGYQVEVEIVNPPMMAGGVSGTDMRRFIADGDYESFAKFVPLKDPSKAWKIVRPDIQEGQSQEVADFLPFLHGLIREVLTEKAKSKSQQKYFGMVKACQEDPSDCASDDIKKKADSMKSSDVDDFAGTKHKDLPEKVKEEEELEEISAMSVGSVEIGAGSATGKKKKPYNPWDQSEYEKPLSFGFTNYHCLNFFTSSARYPSDVPSDSALVFPSPTVNDKPGRFFPSASFSYEFYINPRYTTDYKDEVFHTGTILNMPNCYSVSLVSGSGRDSYGRVNTFRLMLQLGFDSSIPPAHIDTGVSNSNRGKRKIFLFLNKIVLQ